ncbi:bck1-like resistance to osmotic shock, partial [Coemansia sp. RSA 1285]
MELPQARAINDKWEQAESKKSTVESQILEASQVYHHVRDGLEKAKRFYTMLADSLLQFRGQVKDFVSSRTTQRDQLVQQVVQSSASRNHNMLKERLNQYAVPFADQQQSPRSSYYQSQTQGVPPQNSLSQSPPPQGTHAFDVGQLANQAAQLSLSSPSGINYGMQHQHTPQQHQQPLYSPGASSSAQYQPSAPPYNHMQQQAPMQQHQQQPQQQQQYPSYSSPNQGYPYQTQQPQQQPQQLFGPSSPTFQPNSSVPQPTNVSSALNDSTTDPYSATVRRSMAMEPIGMTSISSPGYKPGYGGTATYTPASVPSYGYTPAASSGQPPYMQQSQSPLQQHSYGGYSDALPPPAVSGP